MHFQHLSVALATLPALISGLPVTSPDALAEDPATAASRVEDTDRKTFDQVSKVGGFGGFGGSSTGSGLGALSSGTSGGSLASLLSGLGGGSATGSGLGALPSGTSGGSLSSLLSGLGSGSAGGASDGSSSTSSSTGAASSADADSGDSSSGGLAGLLGGGSGGSSPFGGFSLGGSTQNDVKDGKCEDVTLIFARGTTETGNMGTVIGPPLASALKKDNPSVAVQGVDYPASAAGNAQMGGSGGPTMASLAQQAKSKCPNTKVVLSGYSQGAMVVHNALGKLDGSDVAAVIVFGDPLNGSGFKGVDKSKALEVCGSSDFLCDRAGSDLKVNGSHLSYTSSATEAAAWVAKTVGGGSGSGSAAESATAPSASA